MKTLTQIFSVLLIIILAAGNIQAQETENPMLIVSSQKVKLSDMGTISKMMSENFAPILSGLVDEGMIYSWGTFNHAWGDEWNMNVWYVAKDMTAFESFWSEYMKRIDEQKSEAWAKMVGYIQEHKDNIYTITNQYPVPQR